MPWLLCCDTVDIEGSLSAEVCNFFVGCFWRSGSAHKRLYAWVFHAFCMSYNAGYSFHILYEWGRWNGYVFCWGPTWLELVGWVWTLTNRFVIPLVACMGNKNLGRWASARGKLMCGKRNIDRLYSLYRCELSDAQSSECRCRFLALRMECMRASFRLIDRAKHVTYTVQRFTVFGRVHSLPEAPSRFGCNIVRLTEFGNCSAEVPFSPAQFG